MTNRDNTNYKLFLENIYMSHHERGNRYGYLYCHGERGSYLAEWIGAEKDVLDLGCRDGELTKFFVNKNNVTGVDIDRQALDIVQKNLGIKTFWLDLNTEFPFERESYDVVVACEIVEHIYYPEVFIEKIYNTLRPGGLFLGSVPNSFRFRNRLKFLFGKEFETDPTHVHMFSYRQLCSILSKFFRDIHIVPLGGKILPFWKVSGKSPYILNKIFGRDLLWRAVKGE
jgi:2-polyprenyl-3-methyl-5-hydroxy-6-metoxy-1,4-benzoquinol methylase